MGEFVRRVTADTLPALFRELHALADDVERTFKDRNGTGEEHRGIVVIVLPPKDAATVYSEVEELAPDMTGAQSFEAGLLATRGEYVASSLRSIVSSTMHTWSRRGLVVEAAQG